jgi:hypothetical protein
MHPGCAKFSRWRHAVHAGGSWNGGRAQSPTVNPQPDQLPRPDDNHVPGAGSGVYAGDDGVPIFGCCIRSPFGDDNTSTNYLGAVPGDSGVTITYALPQRQLNLLWGTIGLSPGWRDQIVLVFSDSTIGTITGDDVAATGTMGENQAVEITTEKPFTTAIFSEGGAPSFEFVPSVPVVLFAGTPGKANCVGQSVSALATQYGGLNAAAASLDFATVAALQNAIMGYCGG